MRDRIRRMTTKQIHELIANSTDGDAIDEAYDELELRERQQDEMDWTEIDRMAAQSERIEMYRNEY
jgi:hypothetical protein